MFVPNFVCDNYVHTFQEDNDEPSVITSVPILMSTITERNREKISAIKTLFAQKLFFDALNETNQMFRSLISKATIREIQVERRDEFTRSHRQHDKVDTYCLALENGSMLEICMCLFDRFIFSNDFCARLMTQIEIMECLAPPSLLPPAPLHIAKKLPPRSFAMRDCPLTVTLGPMIDCLFGQDLRVMRLLFRFCEFQQFSCVSGFGFCETV
jgi:hypothetical protein